MGNVKDLKRKLVNKAASTYLCDQEEGDLYDAYLKLQEAEEKGNSDDLAANHVTVWQPLEHMRVDELLGLIDAEVSNIESNHPAFMQNMDWQLLKEQKKSLLEVMNTVTTVEQGQNLEGILNAIDAMQDYAVDVMGLDENLVFDLTQED